MRPPYITATRWATSATTPRSWVMRIAAAPGLGLAAGEQRQHLGLHGDVEGGRRLVGDDELRAAGHGHGDHGALAHAAGELVRVLGGADLRGRRCRPRAGARPRALRARPRARRPWSTWPSTTWAPTGSTGLSVVVGSWKTIPTSRPRMRRSRFAVRPDHLLPAEADGAGHPRRVGQEPGDGERGDALARARLADDAEHLVRRGRRS